MRIPSLPLLATALAACTGGPQDAQLPDDEPVPDFSLVDVNPTSDRYGEAVSPRDYLDQVSAWYFGHST